MTGPRVVDNRRGNTYSRSIKSHLKALRQKGESPDELCIATGYFNAAGWMQVAKETERIPKVRLLIGAEPTPHAEMIPRNPGEAREPERTREQVKNTLETQVKDLIKERDTGFDFHPEGLGRLKRLLEFFSSDKVEVRRYQEKFFHAKAWIIKGQERGVLAGSSNLTAAGMLHNLELNLGEYEDPILTEVENWFEEVWEEAEPFDLAALYEELFKEFSPWFIYLRVLWELYGDEVHQEEEDTGLLTLTRFQKHGVWRAKHVLDELGGVIIADGVGLGKTFVAGGIMEEYRDRRQRILLIRPAALEGTWDKFLSKNFLGDVESISYEKLASDFQFEGEQHHLKRPIDEYQLIVIDEAHNYRNPDARTRAGVLRSFMRGPKRDLALLTATPVNNSLYDLYHLISFFVKQDSRLIDKGIASIKALFDEANRIEPGELHPDKLYPLVDATTVKRTRQFIKKHYQDDKIPNADGVFVPITFPKPIAKSVFYNLDELLPGFFARFADAIMPDEGDPKLTMGRYQVHKYLLVPDPDNPTKELPLVGLLRSGLLKRFESSAHAFANTCEKMAAQHVRFLEVLEQGHVIQKDFFKDWGAAEDMDEEQLNEILNDGGYLEDAKFYDEESLKNDVQNDLNLLNEFAAEARFVKPENDPKLKAIVFEIVNILEEAQANGNTAEQVKNNRKVLIFSYYKDTALWILDYLKIVLNSDPRLAEYKDRMVATCGTPNGVDVLDSDIASWGFAPETAAPDTYRSGDKYDILIATDVLAEGVNLQQCRNIINYDLPWNPMRLIQRHGRIDRLLSNHKRVFLRTFFPDAVLDKLLQLETRVRQKLALAAASVGVASTPIQGGAERNLTFSETRDEIESLAREESDLYERGGSESAAQTGEEYRQELRKAFEAGLHETIATIPWKAGSGMVKGSKSGHFFCAKVGDKTYLRFVPETVTDPENVINELGTCLRLIECEESTERVFDDRDMDSTFSAWSLARESIWNQWDYFTDPINLQPRVRKLNREVDEFLLDNPLVGEDPKALERVSDTLMSPWPMREENKLREVWKVEHKSNQEKASKLIEAVRVTGIEPFEQPERFPKIDLEEVRLVCWLRIQAS
jgi:hypothetical protein